MALLVSFVVRLVIEFLWTFLGIYAEFTLEIEQSWLWYQVKIASSHLPPYQWLFGVRVRSYNLPIWKSSTTLSWAAMRNFCPNSVLGEGGFGSIKGWRWAFTCRYQAGTSIVIFVKRLSQEGFEGPNDSCQVSIVFWILIQFFHSMHILAFCCLLTSF